MKAGEEEEEEERGGDCGHISHSKEKPLSKTPTDVSHCRSKNTRCGHQVTQSGVQPH